MFDHKASTFKFARVLEFVPVEDVRPASLSRRPRWERRRLPAARPGLAARRFPARPGVCRAWDAADGAGSESTFPRVVSLVYRHGFEQLIVTTRVRTRGGWHDPFASPWLRFRPRRLALQEGALAGARAELVVDERTTPHLWALGTRLVITVAGDATPAEFVRMASSVHPR